MRQSSLLSLWIFISSGDHNLYEIKFVLNKVHHLWLLWTRNDVDLRVHMTRINRNKFLHLQTTIVIKNQVRATLCSYSNMHGHAST